MEVQAYEDESFLDNLSALGDSLINGNSIFTQNFTLGPVSCEHRSKSPVTVISNPDSVGISIPTLTGQGTLMIGRDLGIPSQTVPHQPIGSPDNFTRTQSAVQDKTRR